MAHSIQLTHECGHVLGTFNTPDDHGSFEMHCPKCNEWTEIFNQFLSEAAGNEPFTNDGTTYQDVSSLFPD